MEKHLHYSTGKELADSADVSPETIKKYSNLGLLDFFPAKRGGTRLYKTINSNNRLKLIKKLKDKGYSLARIEYEITKTDKCISCEHIKENHHLLKEFEEGSPFPKIGECVQCSCRKFKKLKSSPYG